MTFEPILKTSLDVRTVEAVLAEAAIGAVIEYTAISNKLGYDICKKRYILQRAIENLSKQSGAIFAPVWKVGLMRLPPQDAHLLGVTARARIRRRARRAGQFMMRAVTQANDMPRAAALAANREIAVLGLIEYASSEKAVKAASTEEDAPMPVAKLMSQMLDKI